MSDLLNCQPLGEASPSRVEVLRACGYRVVLSRTATTGGSGTPWTRLGSACHSVFEAAARGELGDGDGSDFDAAFDRAWVAAVAEQAAAANADPAEASWGPPPRWPGYAIKKARMRRRARELAQEATSWNGGDIRVEEELHPPGEILFGKPDLIVRQPAPYRVIDYKTGAVTDDAGDLHGAYRRQLLLYAHLERLMPDGGEPTLAVVVPLEGQRIEFPIDWDEVDREVAEAHRLVAAYNAGLVDPEALATPSSDACGRCPFAARCDSFWSELPKDVPTAEGIVTAVQHTDAGTVSVTVDVEHGSVAGGLLHLHRFPVARNPALGTARVGDRLRVVSFRLLDDESRTARAAGWTRSFITAASG